MSQARVVMPRSRAYRTWIAVSASLCTAVLASPRTSRAQSGSARSVDAEVGAQAALLNGATAAPNFGGANTWLGSAQAGVRTRWSKGFLAADASFALATASFSGAHTLAPLGQFHVAAQRGSVSLSLGLEQGLGITVSSRRPHDSTFTDPVGDTAVHISVGNSSESAVATQFMRTSYLVGGVAWHRSRVSVQLLSGIQASDLRTGPWFGANTTLDMGRSALIIEARRQPSHAALQMPAVSLGIRTSYWHWGNGVPVRSRAPAVPAPAPRIHFIADSVQLELYRPRANRVALMGDLTAWQSRSMHHDAGGWWRVMLPVTAGLSTSRIVVRDDDGAWTPIDGLPTVHDEYGGTTSVLVVPADTPRTSPPA